MTYGWVGVRADRKRLRREVRRDEIRKGVGLYDWLSDGWKGKKEKR